jgi:Peptidase_C39 like family
MQKKHLKYLKFLFIGLFLIGLTTVIIRIVTPRPLCVPVVSSVPACLTGKDFVELEINLFPQQADSWCWAASIQMCINYINGVEISQCQIVSDRFNLTSSGTFGTAYNACACPKSDDGCTYPLIGTPCNLFSRPLTPKNPCAEHNTIKSILEKYNLTTQIIEINSTTTLNDIQNNLCAGNPIIAILKAPSTYHIVVIKGYQIIDSTSSYLLVNNPMNLKNIASCDGCYHVIPISRIGKSTMAFLGSGPIGTYQPLMYFSIIPKP